MEFLKNIIGNFLLFLPWGFLLPVLMKKARSFRFCIILTTTVLFLTETIQLLSMRGFFDLEDIILNILGACTGYFIFSILKKKTKMLQS